VDFLLLGFVVLLAVGAAARRRGVAPSSRTRRWARLVGGGALGLFALLALLGGVGSIGAAAVGDSGDMDPSEVVVLGLVYLSVAAAGGWTAFRLLRR
jgi:hypothetical protein